MTAPLRVILAGGMSRRLCGVANGLSIFNEQSLLAVVLGSLPTRMAVLARKASVRITSTSDTAIEHITDSS